MSTLAPPTPEPGVGVTVGMVVRSFLIALGMAGALLFWFGVLGHSLTTPARASLAVTSLAVALWASELLPLSVTAIIAVCLLFITRAVPTPEAAFAGFSSPILFFLLGSAGLGIAAEATGLADRLAKWLLNRADGSGSRLLFELMVTFPLQALIVPSAISRNAVLVPVYRRVLDHLGRPPRLGTAVMLALGTLGPLASSALLTGGTSSVAASQALGGFTWISWFVALAPPYYVLLAFGTLAVWLFSRPERTLPASTGKEKQTAMPLTKAERNVALVSVGTSLLWVMDGITHWPPAIPALLALALLMSPRFGVMSWQHFAGRAPWGTCFVLAAAVSLSAALNKTGAAAWAAIGLFHAFPIGRGAAEMALAIFLVTALITLAIPNRAAAITLCIPLATAFAAEGALGVVAAGLVVMIAVDVETIYPAQTAANLLAYDLGYFSSGQLARFNLLTLAGAAATVVLVALPWWALVGLPAHH